MRITQSSFPNVRNAIIALRLEVLGDISPFDVVFAVEKTICLNGDDNE